MGALFNEILYRPLLNALVFLYNTIAFKDMGVAIIMLTVGVRVALAPFFHKSMKHQTVLQRLQPAIKKIQHDHKDNREKQAQALMELYREHQVNPFAGILLIFLQLPILIALYQVFRDIHAIPPEALYSFITFPSVVQPLFLHLINLQERSIILIGLAALAQYIQGRISLSGKRGEKAEGFARQMVFMGPALTILFFWSFPAALGLYWCATSIFSLGQQFMIQRALRRTDNATDHGPNTISEQRRKTD